MAGTSVKLRHAQQRVAELEKALAFIAEKLDVNWAPLAPVAPVLEALEAAKLSAPKAKKAAPAKDADQ